LKLATVIDASLNCQSIALGLNDVQTSVCDTLSGSIDSLWFVFCIIAWTGTFSIPLYFLFADKVLFNPSQLSKADSKFQRAQSQKTQIKKSAVANLMPVVEVDARNLQNTSQEMLLPQEDVVLTRQLTQQVKLDHQISERQQTVHDEGEKDMLLEELTMVIARRRASANMTAMAQRNNENKTRALEDNLVRDLSIRSRDNSITRQRSNSAESSKMSRKVSFIDVDARATNNTQLPVIQSQDELYEASAPDQD